MTQQVSELSGAIRGLIEVRQAGRVVPLSRVPLTTKGVLRPVDRL